MTAKEERGKEWDTDREKIHKKCSIEDALQSSSVCYNEVYFSGQLLESLNV